MAELHNSQRRLLKATYSPLTFPANAQPECGRAIEKMIFLRALNPRPAELEALAARKCADAPSPQAPALPPSKIIEVVSNFVTDASAGAIQHHGPILAQTKFEDLRAFARAIIQSRHSLVSQEPSHSEILVVATTPFDSTLLDATIAAVGWLHLERLQMTPVGVEHGELIHSVPLTPKETVNISHREWSATTKTFETFVEDSFEGFSETGVAEKSDLAQATDNEAKHTSSLDVNGTITANYNGAAYAVTATAASDYNDREEVLQSTKDSVAHSLAVTRTASARTRKEHKTSFRVSSVAGAEDLAVQVLTNPSDTEAMRVDYYQLLRKWRVDLVRYSLRMTYDIVIPDPGVDLLDKLLHLASLDRELAQDFVFGLSPKQITAQSVLDLTAQYGVHVDPPPADPGPPALFTWNLPWGNNDNRTTFETYTFNLDDNYSIKSGMARAHFAHYPDAPNVAFGLFEKPGLDSKATDTYSGDLPRLVGKTGALSVTLIRCGVSTGVLSVAFELGLREGLMDAWQTQAWQAMHDAALESYNQRLEKLKAQRAQLASEIAAVDALTLRKMEREEIMKLVLQWLFGPAFTLPPAFIKQLVDKNPAPFPDAGGYRFPDVHALSALEWEQVLRYGEMIRYLHNAIEWENVVYFVYPYFWDYYGNWPFKRFLMHPDPVHRDFLRSGSARVVLPVRPGFETSFAMLMETGNASLPPDPSAYPYVSIGEETRNFAMTNYEGIPPANPEANVRPLLYPQQRKAWQDMQPIVEALREYFEMYGGYPPDLSNPQLAAIAKQRGQPLAAKDPWGRPYFYACPGAHQDYDLACFGKNGRQGGDVEGSDPLDADITSWAEGSIVGRWYEYTPTSALDVAIAMLPRGQAPLPSTPEPG